MYQMAYFTSNGLADPSIGKAKTVALGLQHTFTMFGATILVPLLTGMDISVALFMAGIGTLFFHLVTKGGVPVFLGSSFAFIAPIVLATEAYSLPHALGGIVVAGGVYVLLAVLVHFLGAERIVSFFPPIVTGPVIMVIGLNLAPTAINMASSNWLLALLGFAVVAYVNIFLKGFAKSLPVLIGLAVSYTVASLITLTGAAQLVDFAPIAEAAWLGLPQFVMAEFDIGAIMLVAPVAICTMVEHMGDIIAVGTIVNRDFIKDPGLPRTLIGDGVATSISAMFGGPANTTYSENTGVLALTRAFNPAVMRIAACFAIVLGICPKLGALIRTIPGPIIGGISIVLFGMIASVGARTLVENQVDFQKSRNLIIAAVILVLGIGGASIPFAIGSVSVNLQGMALASIVGIILNKILPGAQKYQKDMEHKAA
jgi:uracil permease